MNLINFPKWPIVIENRGARCLSFEAALEWTGGVRMDKDF